MTRRLIREGDPPAGQPASPVPQYWNPNTEAFEDVLGAHGAPRAILYGPNGQPIGTQTNPLDVRVRELEAKLDELKQTIESGVQLKGSDISVQSIGAGTLLYPVPGQLVSAENEQRHGHYILWEKDGRIFGRNYTRDHVWYSDDGVRTKKIYRFLDTDGLKCWGLVPVTKTKVLAAMVDSGDPSRNGLYVIENIEEPSANQRFERVLAWNRTQPHETIGYDAYPYHGGSRIILVAEYDAAADSSNAGRHVHLSTDGGETWRTIFEMPFIQEGKSHLHSAHYDPYANRIWVVCGDQPADQVYYSDDWFSPTPTWIPVWPDGAKQQFTTVWSTPKHVFFGTDGTGKQGIWAYTRNPAMAREHPLIEPYFTIKETTTQFVATTFRPVPNGRGCYVVLRGITALNRSHILGTGDGVRWFDLFSYGPTQNGWDALPITAVEVDGEVIYHTEDTIHRAPITWQE